MGYNGDAVVLLLATKGNKASAKNKDKDKLINKCLWKIIE